MQLTIDLPENVAHSLQSTWGSNVERAVLEAIGVEGYRVGALTHGEVAQLLGYETSVEVEALLKRAGIYDASTEEELSQGFNTGRRIMVRRDAETRAR